MVNTIHNTSTLYQSIPRPGDHNTCKNNNKVNTAALHYTHPAGTLSLEKSCISCPDKKMQKREKNAGQWWNPHTCTHTLFNTFRKPPMNDILWGTVSFRPTHPLQILTASIHKCTWTVKGRWKLSLLWGIKKSLWLISRLERCLPLSDTQGGREAALNGKQHGPLQRPVRNN